MHVLIINEKERFEFEREWREECTRVCRKEGQGRIITNII